jgi:hypothetical protein
MIDDQVQLIEINLYNDVEYDQINHENENDGNLYRLLHYLDQKMKNKILLEATEKIEDKKKLFFLLK